MIRAITAVILVSVLSPACFANTFSFQQDDSLFSLNQQGNDSSRIAGLLKLSWENRNSSPELSVKYGNEAISLAEKYKDYYSLSSAYSFVGVAYRVMGKYSKALDNYYLGLEVALKNDISEQAGYSYLNLANLYVYQELASLARENLRKAEAIAAELNDKRMMAYANIYCGRIYNYEYKLDSALFCYRRSLLLRQELNLIAEQATCYKYIGDIYFEKGDYKTAIENYNLSLEKVDMQNDRDLYANLLIKKSQILLKENKIPEARTTANEALRIAKEIGANKTIRDALQLLSELALITRDYNTASELQRKVIQYDDSLYSKQLSEKIFFLEYQFERQQRNNRIDILNRDNSIKELQLKRGRFISVGLTIILLLLATVFVILLILLRQRRKHEVLLEINNQQIIKQRDSIESQYRQLTETNRKLEKSEEDLKRIVQTKDKLLSIIAHDLRNPFTALIGLTDLMQKNAENTSREELTQYISMINESSHKLLWLLENLLAWARSQTGNLKPVMADLNLRSQVEDVLNLYLSQAETKGVDLINEIPPEISVHTDSKILATIIRNLVSNGIKFTRRGGQVNCSAYRENGNTVLKIQDTGIGMDEAFARKLFSADEPLSIEGTNSEAGTGLGLVICREFARTLGGTISVESSSGTGTSFFVALPGEIKNL